MGNCCFPFTSLVSRSPPVLPLFPNKKTIKILSLDGGGIRGLIQLIILIEIERITKKPIFSLFDLIVGTSIGGIIALGLTTPKEGGAPKGRVAGGGGARVAAEEAEGGGRDGRSLPLFNAKEMLDLLQKNANTVFHRSILKRIQSLGGLRDEKYSSKALEDLLSSSLGTSLLSNSLTLLFLPSFDLSSYSTQFFRSYDTKRDYLRKLVGRAISAAPTYFELAIVDSIEKKQSAFNANSGEVRDKEQNEVEKVDLNTNVGSKEKEQSAVNVISNDKKDDGTSEGEKIELNMLKPPNPSKNENFDCIEGGMALEGQSLDLNMSKPPNPSKNETFYCIDGGVVLNNPSLAAYVEAHRIFPNAIHFFVLSIGCGREITKFSVSSARTWGVLEWIQPLIDIMMDGRDDEIDRQMRDLLGEGYVRWQFGLKDGLGRLDDASEKNLEGLAEVGKEWVEGKKKELDKVCKILGGV